MYSRRLNVTIAQMDKHSIQASGDNLSSVVSTPVVGKRFRLMENRLKSRAAHMSGGCQFGQRELDASGKRVRVSAGELICAVPELNRTQTSRKTSKIQFKRWKSESNANEPSQAQGSRFERGEPIHLEFGLVVVRGSKRQIRAAGDCLG
jgi:hypothetical protein